MKVCAMELNTELNMEFYESFHKKQKIQSQIARIT